MEPALPSLVPQLVLRRLGMTAPASSSFLGWGEVKASEARGAAAWCPVQPLCPHPESSPHQAAMAGDPCESEALSGVCHELLPECTMPTFHSILFYWTVSFS